MAFPILGQMNDQELSGHLFLKAAQLYNQGNNVDDAIRLLEVAIRINNKNVDAYEALGVIWGHQKQYDEAIKLMKTLSDLDPHSVMAHTNLRLFYMKRRDRKSGSGKGQSDRSGNEAGQSASKKNQEKKIVQKEKEQELASERICTAKFWRLIRMTPLLIIVWPNIYFEQDKVKKSIEHLRKALISNPKYSLAYLLLGKTLESSGAWQEAKSIYQKAKKVAAAQGDIAVANEIQEKLKKNFPLHQRDESTA